LLINHGKIVADSDPENLRTRSNSNFQVVVVEFDKKTNEELFESIEGVKNIKKVNEYSWILESDAGDDIRPKIFNLAVKNNITVLSMQKKDKKLEEVFFELTGNKNSGKS
jgi:ABC-2 type transport system ATP-binding protein